MKNTAKTRTYTYLLPELAEYINIERELVINLFLGIKSKSSSFNGTVILYMEKTNNLDMYEQSSYWLSTTVVDNGLLVEYMYPDPELYNKFVQGLYSKFDIGQKNRIKKYFNLSSENKVMKILSRHPELKKQMEGFLNVNLTNMELGERVKFEEELYE